MKSSSFANGLFSFYRQLQPPQQLPKGVEILYPQQNEVVMTVVQQFLSKFYADNKSRRLMLGINPGRLGAGITGVNFTAPKQLTVFCHLPHPFGNSSELSAEFVYEMIEAYGGVNEFYSQWFIGAVCPLGFVKNGKNMNYYDDKKLQAAVTPFIIGSINQQLELSFERDYCVCIGGEKNYRFLSDLNEKHQWFNKIIPVPHPRFIMQYRRQDKDIYIDQYLAALNHRI